MANLKAPQITPFMLDMLEQIGEILGRFAERSPQYDISLRRAARVKTIHATLQMAGNPLSLEQVGAIRDAKQIVAAPKDIQEVNNALKAYDCLDAWMPDSPADLLQAHTTMLNDLLDDPGQYRSGFVRVKQGESIVYIAPPAHKVNKLISELFKFIDKLELHPLLTSCIFHYELEYIHPFSDGNGRLGRLWQSLVLSKWKPAFKDIPLEAFIKEHQQEYYDVINQSNKENHPGAFIEFMLSLIHETISTIFPSEQTPVIPSIEPPVVQSLNSSVTASITPLQKPPVKPSVIILLALLNKRGKLGNSEILKRLHLKDRRRMRESYIKPAIESGLIEYTIPDKPTSRNQQYQLTPLGKSI